MAEYIEREALRKAVRSKTMTKYDWSEEIDFEDFEKVLDGIPAADVVPVVHGRWNELYDADRELWYFDCPFCGDDYSAVTKYLQNYCPNCGARMDGE